MFTVIAILTTNERSGSVAFAMYNKDPIRFLSFKLPSTLSASSSFRLIFMGVWKIFSVGYHIYN